MSNAHSIVLVSSLFMRRIQSVEDVNVQRVLKTLCDYFVLSLIEEELGEFMESGYIAPEQVPFLRQALDITLDALRPDLVSLADAWGFSDFLLGMF